MFANCQLGGLDAEFPDVCKTPPAAIPIPYPNFALGPMGVPAAYKVLVSYAPAHNLATTIPMTNGDNPGVLLGLVSQTVMMQQRHLTAAFHVLMCGPPATRLTSISMHNTINAPPGMRVVPSQVKVILLGI